jgi:hypothetical protein
MTEHEMREKVIKGLDTCGISGTREDCEGYGCPYFIYNDGVSDDCQVSLFGDALALLKTQEPIKPGTIMYTAAGVGIASCPQCGDKIDAYHNLNYCGRCGQAVKWE